MSRLPVSSEKRLPQANRKFGQGAQLENKNKLNLWKQNQSAENGQHLPLTLHSYPNLYVAFICAYLSIYLQPWEGWFTGEHGMPEAQNVVRL